MVKSKHKLEIIAIQKMTKLTKISAAWNHLFKLIMAH